MTVEQVLREMERSFIWHSIGDLLHGFDPVWLAIGLVLLVVLALSARAGRAIALQGRTSAAAPAAARQSSVSTVFCACGRKWTVRA
jgi:hypothetical protein